MKDFINLGGHKILHLPSVVSVVSIQKTHYDSKEGTYGLEIALRHSHMIVFWFSDKSGRNKAFKDIARELME